MNHIQKFEAYALSTAKDLTKKWKESGMEQKYDDIFGKGVYRKYIRFIPTQEDKTNFSGQTYVQELVNSKLNYNGYRVIDYMQGTAIKYNDDKNITKIGKLLQRFDPMLKQQYDADPLRSGKKMLDLPLSIVISRHAYDIGGMSTGRGWRSCMHLVDGENKRFVKEDIVKGSIVAYVIREEDTNIQNPIARLLIKPFVKKDRNGQEITILETDQKMYGFTIESFRKVVDSWLANINDPSKKGRFHLADGLYNDGKKHVDKTPQDFEVSQDFENGMTVIVSELNGHYRLLDDEGKIATPQTDYSAIVRVEVEPKLVYSEVDMEHQSMFFYALEENIERKKVRRNLEVYILDKNGEVIIGNNTLQDDYDLLYDYLMVRSFGETYIIDTVSKESVIVKQSKHTEKYCIYESKEGFALLDKANRVTYPIDYIGVRVADILKLKALAPTIFLVRFVSGKAVILSIIDGKIETTTLHGVEDYNGTFDRHPILMHIDRDEDTYAAVLNGELVHFTLDGKTPEITNLITRDGKEDIIVAMEDAGFFSVRRKEFMFDDINFIRYNMQNNNPLVVLTNGSSHGLVNVLTGKVLLELDKKYRKIFLATTHYFSKLNIADDESLMQLNIEENGKLLTMFIDERGKITTQASVEEAPSRINDFSAFHIPPMPM